MILKLVLREQFLHYTYLAATFKDNFQSTKQKNMVERPLYNLEKKLFFREKLARRLHIKKPMGRFLVAENIMKKYMVSFCSVLWYILKRISFSYLAE